MVELYDLKIEYIPGENNVLADFGSRNRGQLWDSKQII